MLLFNVCQLGGGGGTKLFLLLVKLCTGSFSAYPEVTLLIKKNHEDITIFMGRLFYITDIKFGAEKATLRK